LPPGPNSHRDSRGFLRCGNRNPAAKEAGEAPQEGVGAKTETATFGAHGQFILRGYNVLPAHLFCHEIDMAGAAVCPQ
jgi:hypothetical protein